MGVPADVRARPARFIASDIASLNISGVISDRAGPVCTVINIKLTPRIPNTIQYVAKILSLLHCNVQIPAAEKVKLYV